MTSTMLDRRTLVLGAAASTVLFPLGRATAQTAAATGDWLAIIKSQHAQIAATLSQAIADATSLSPRLSSDLQQLGYQLTAHSVAEENVLYPALAFNGIPIGSAELYLEQDAQKVLNTRINLEVLDGTEAAKLVEGLETLRNIILKHANEHEEADLYPQLHQKLTSEQNAALTQAYTRFYSMVKQA